MAKSKKKVHGVRHFFYYTRPGFYILVLLAVVGFTTTINAINSSNEPDPSVLAANDNRGRNPEVQQQKEVRQEEHKQEIRQNFRIEPEGLRVEFKSENKGVEKKLEHKVEELSLSEERTQELTDKIVNEFEFENEVRIATDGGGLVVKKNKVKAHTGFPLSIDVSTGTLIVTRPDGTQKEVAILPDQAVQNFLRHKKIELISPEPPDDGDEDETGTESADAGFVGIQSVGENLEGIAKETGAEAEVEIIERNNELVYEIKGKRKVRVLGFIPAETSLTGYVSTETGEVVGESQPLFDRLLNLISLQL
jgi:hypothetical protein